MSYLIADKTEPSLYFLNSYSLIYLLNLEKSLQNYSKITSLLAITTALLLLHMLYFLLFSLFCITVCYLVLDSCMMIYPLPHFPCLEVLPRAWFSTLSFYYLKEIMT